jgi:hypothetical protein
VEYLDDPGTLLDTDETGVVVGGGVPLAVSDSAAVVLHVITAFTRGLLISTVMHVRGPNTPQGMASLMHTDGPEGLLLGFSYHADATPQLFPPGRPPLAAGQPPLWQLVNGRGGGGGEHRIRIEATFAVVPYPTSLTLNVAISWTLHSINATAVPIALPALSEIQERSRPFWRG